MPTFIADVAFEKNRVIGLPKKLGVLLALLILADWVFFYQSVGISLALFILCVAVGLVTCNPRHTSSQNSVLSSIILFAALLPIVENFGFLSILFGLVGIAYFAVAITAGTPDGIAEKFFSCGKFLAEGLVQFAADLIQFASKTSTKETKRPWIKTLTVWILPIALVIVFTALFASANPLIGDWLSHIDLWAIISLVSFPRLIFWLIAAIALWPFVFVKQRDMPDSKNRAGILRDQNRMTTGSIFSEAAIFRSLVLCNLLFAIQTTTDLAYLWAGVTLPDGLTYAAYAHRGAYLLMITALLAGAFVTIAMRPDSPAEKSSPIRHLVYVWIAQNVVLVLSSALRLNLYVAAYSLTVWRAAAFVCMFLVAAGLVAIVARIVLSRPSSWLVATMIYVILGTFYVVSFIDTAYLIATYNVSHCREVTGNGTSLDLNYLKSLGPDVIPAFDKYRRQVPATMDLGGETAALGKIRQELANTVAADLSNWRSWSFRNWRLEHYLERNGGGLGRL